MEKIDFIQIFRQLYTAGQEIEEIVAERAVFLCVDGCGEPVGDDYNAAVGLLYCLVRTVKKQLKEAELVDFEIARLEFRWMCDPEKMPKQEWRWRVMIRVPDNFSQQDLKKARKSLLHKKGTKAAAVKRVCWREGRVLQVRHIGSLDDVDEKCSILLKRAADLGYGVRGAHHLVYTSDPRRTAPEKQKTIVRLPISWPRPSHAYGKSERPAAG